MADPSQPPRRVALLPVRSSSDGFDFSRSERFGQVGQVFIAQFGDQAPQVGKTLNPVGFKVVRVNVKTGVSRDFAVNPGKQSGPASLLGTGGLKRPVAVRFSSWHEGAIRISTPCWPASACWTSPDGRHRHSGKWWYRQLKKTRALRSDRGDRPRLVAQILS